MSLFRVQAARENVEVDVLESVRAGMLLDLHPFVAEGGESSPGCAQPLLETRRAPVLAALHDSTRREKEDRLRSGQSLGTWLRLPVGRADGAGLLELVAEAVVNVLDDLAVACHIDHDGGPIGR